MTGTEVALIITATGAWVTAVGGLILQFMGQNEARKERRNLTLGQTELKMQMKAVQISTDGVVETLALAKLAQGTAEGNAVGLAAGRAEGLKK